MLDGFTGDQRLFLGYAQVWRFKAREEVLRQAGAFGFAQPTEFRSTAPCGNVDAWYDARGVMPAQALPRPANRVHLWWVGPEFFPLAARALAPALALCGGRETVAPLGRGLP